MSRSIAIRARHILLPKDYIRFKRTGEFAIEVSDASGMNLLDVPNRCWSDEILEKLDLDKAVRESLPGVPNGWRKWRI